jgi:hypothetical protein
MEIMSRLDEAGKKLEAAVARLDRAFRRGGPTAPGSDLARAAEHEALAQERDSLRALLKAAEAERSRLGERVERVIARTRALIES